MVQNCNQLQRMTQHHIHSLSCHTVSFSLSFLKFSLFCNTANYLHYVFKIILWIHRQKQKEKQWPWQLTSWSRPTHMSTGRRHAYIDGSAELQKRLPLYQVRRLCRDYHCTRYGDYGLYCFPIKYCVLVGQASKPFQPESSLHIIVISIRLKQLHHKQWPSCSLKGALTSQSCYLHINFTVVCFISLAGTVEP